MTALSAEMLRGREDRSHPSLGTIISFPGMRSYIHNALSVLGQVETRLGDMQDLVEVSLVFNQLPNVRHGRASEVRSELYIDSANGNALSQNYIGQAILFAAGMLPHPSNIDKPVHFSFGISFTPGKKQQGEISAQRIKDGVDNLVTAMRSGIIYDFSGWMVANDVRAKPK